MQHKWPTREAVAIVVTLVALSAPISGQRADSPPVTLTLECVDSANIRFEITNVGPADTALPLGMVLANGRKYLIGDLHLRMTPPNGSGTDYRYWPRDYPAAVAGRMDQWFQAFPVRAVYSMSATADDFLSSGGRAAFPRGTPLSLRWTLSAEPPKSLVPLVYWTGTLVSNSCTTP